MRCTFGDSPWELVSFTQITFTTFVVQWATTTLIGNFWGLSKCFGPVSTLVPPPTRLTYFSSFSFVSFVLPAAFILSQSTSQDWLSLSRVAWHSGVFKHTHEPAHHWNSAPLPAWTMPALPITFALHILSFWIQSRGLSERACARRFLQRSHTQHLISTAAEHHSTSLQSRVAAGYRGASSLHPAHFPKPRRCTLWCPSLLPF